MLERLGQDRKQETSSLARACLCASHEITSTHDDGNGILLYRGRSGVVCELNVAEKMIVEGRIRESIHRLRDILAASLNRNVIVVGKVDTGLLFAGIVGDTEEFPLHFGICGSGNMLSISPLSLSCATSCASAVAASVAATVTWSTVCVGVEGTSIALTDPAVGLLDRSAWASSIAPAAIVVPGIQVSKSRRPSPRQGVLTCCLPMHCHSSLDLQFGGSTEVQGRDPRHPSPLGEVHEDRVGHGDEEECTQSDRSTGPGAHVSSRSRRDRSCSKNQP